MKINKYFFFVFVYYFINSVGLPHGLTYMAILSPLLYYWVVTTRRTEIVMPFLIVLAPFFLMHIIHGVDFGSYMVSLFNLTTVYVFGQAVYTFAKVCKDPEKILRYLLYITFILCLI